MIKLRQLSGCLPRNFHRQEVSLPFPPWVMNRGEQTGPFVGQFCSGRDEKEEKGVESRKANELVEFLAHVSNGCPLGAGCELWGGYVCGC